MAHVIVTIKIMPESPDVNLKNLRSGIESKVKKFAGKTPVRFEEVPIGFGLSSLNVTFSMDEAGESTDKLEEDLKRIKGISNAEVIDMRRALG